MNAILSTQKYSKKKMNIFYTFGWVSMHAFLCA